MVQLDPDQIKVRDACLDFTRRHQSGHLTIGGYAGTGKTTVTAEMIRTIRKEIPGIVIAFCCYTGKAASVLRSKLEKANALASDEYCGTIHGLMYTPILDDNDKIIAWKRAREIDADLIIVDEASMVNKAIWDDIQSYRIPTIAIGDHGQLPPIEGAFNLMSNPHHVLTKVHRQAENDPIIRVSLLAREYGVIPIGRYSPEVIKIQADVQRVLDQVKDIRGTLFLCGRNKTRNKINDVIRGRLGFNGSPQKGEKVICLKNNRTEQIYNGVGGVINAFDPLDKDWARVQIEMETGIIFNGMVIIKQFGAETTLKEYPGIESRDLRELFDFGYCITVHKSQGSEADNVVFFEERFRSMDEENWKRFVYTAVTRAKKRLVIVSEN